MKNTVSIGIPCYHAKNTIYKTLASIQSQTVDADVILGIDDGEDYSDIIQEFSRLTIKQVGVGEKNGGPGVARQRCLNACETPFITFMDADDVFYNPQALEILQAGFDKPSVVVSQGGFVSGGYGVRNDPNHPWVFGRMYNVEFLKQNKIEFSSLRAMEDGEFNAKIRMSIEGTPVEWKITDIPVYFWCDGSEHSITRTGVELELEGKPKGLPLYNYGLCNLGAAICFKNAIDFVKKTNPFNPSLMRTATEIMVSGYFQYFETLENASIYAEQCLWTSRWFYYNCFKNYENLIDDETLQQITMPQFARLKKMPTKTFDEWFAKIKESKPSFTELEEIRKKLPQEVLELEDKTGVAGNILEQFYEV